MAEQKKNHSIDELNRLYQEAETVDKDIWSEQRSNILLAAGEHYVAKNSKWWNRIRDSRDVTNEQKLRLTKNHTHRIAKTYINNIVSQAPGVSPMPNNPKELQDQKAAELNKSVWQYAKSKQQLNLKFQSYAKDFIEIGEAAVKIYWDANAGRFLGYEQAVDEMTGALKFDEMGRPEPSEKPVFSGDLLFERIYGFNLLRAPEAKTMAESEWLCVRKMLPVKDLKEMVDPDLREKIVATRDETFFVFDGARATYNKAENQALVKEFYFRPCIQYPNGYYYITCQELILFEGELPFGLFPIVYEGFDEISTTPRHRSIIKQVRPFQSEINRAASKMAEHQVTLGDDKVILQNGSKITTGPQVPGIRTMFVTGQAPTILEGRTGAQYLEYALANVTELYQVVNLEEEMAEKPDQSSDPMATLYRSIRNKKKFSLYSNKFEGFLVRICELYLDLARHYFDDNMLIPAIGKSEYVNVSEFRNSQPLCYQIRVEPLSDDIETMMGKHLGLNHILQYVGQSLEKDDIGKVIRQMPFVNSDETFSDFTLDYDTATNIILALDRGQEVVPRKSDNDSYILKRLAARQKMSDYQLLNPQIQMNYDQLVMAYEQMQAQKAMDLKAAQSEFIPSSGAMIKIDYYVPDPKNPSRSVRATLPAESVDWLIKQLTAQGTSQEAIATQPGYVQQDIARMLLNQNSAGAQGSSPADVLPIKRQGGLQ